MATSFQNKLNDLEARLKAENESRRRDRLTRNLDLSTANSRRTRPCKCVVLINENLRFILLNSYYHSCFSVFPNLHSSFKSYLLSILFTVTVSVCLSVRVCSVISDNISSSLYTKYF